ncbi:MAG TPA: TIGR01777 family oxidoreductase, partial [Polyangiaceae bacterium]
AEWGARVGQSDAVVNLAGEGIADGRWTRERLAQIRRSRIESTSAIAEAIAAADKKPAYVSGSAVGIYGMRKDDRVLDENGEHGTDVLVEICEAWEKATEPARRAGARVALARTGIVMGPDGGALAKMLPPFRAFAGGPLGDGNQWLSWIHIEDAVRGILFALDRADFDGPFNLSAPKPVTMNDFARALGRALHRPSVIRVPAVALKVALGEGLAETLLSGQRAVPALLERAGFTFRFEDVGVALRDLVGG